MVSTLFPLAVGPRPQQLALSGPGVLWVAALLAALLSLNSLFMSDFEDGSLDLSDENLLVQVHRDRDFPTDRHNHSQMDTLLQGHLMLRYHNSRSWYDAHPLLWERLRVPTPAWDQVVEVCS